MDTKAIPEPTAAPSRWTVLLRRGLEILVEGCMIFAALGMTAILVSIVVQVLGGLLGFYVRGTDAYAGYAMAGATFLALAHTFRRNEHLRVTVFLVRCKGATRRALELVAIAVALAVTGFFSLAAWRMVVWSYGFNDVSMQDDATPLWIPQIAMAVGVSALFLVLVEDLIDILAGKPIEEAPEELSHVE